MGIWKEAACRNSDAEEVHVANEFSLVAMEGKVIIPARSKFQLSRVIVLTMKMTDYYVSLRALELEKSRTFECLSKGRGLVTEQNLAELSS